MDKLSINEAEPSKKSAILNLTLTTSDGNPVVVEVKGSDIVGQSLLDLGLAADLAELQVTIKGKPLLLEVSFADNGVENDGKLMVTTMAAYSGDKGQLVLELVKEDVSAFTKSFLDGASEVHFNREYSFVNEGWDHDTTGYGTMNLALRANGECEWSGGFLHPENSSRIEPLREFVENSKVTGTWIVTSTNEMMLEPGKLNLTVNSVVDGHGSVKIAWAGGSSALGNLTRKGKTLKISPDVPSSVVAHMKKTGQITPDGLALSNHGHVLSEGMYFHPMGYSCRYVGEGDYCGEWPCCKRGSKDFGSSDHEPAPGCRRCSDGME